MKTAPEIELFPRHDSRIAASAFWIREAVPHRPPPALYLTRARATKSPALLPPYTTGSVRIRSNLDIKLGRVIGGGQWRAADRRCASRWGHSSKRASGLGAAFVGALCRRIDSQGVDPRSLNWKISSPGKSAGAVSFGRPLRLRGRPAGVRPRGSHGIAPERK